MNGQDEQDRLIARNAQAGRDIGEHIGKHIGKRIGKVYRPGETPEAGEPPPSGLALGDAWFWHGDETLLHELVSHPDVDPGHAAIRLLGFNGARLNEYIGDGAFAGVIRMHLVPGFQFNEFYLGASSTKPSSTAWPCSTIAHTRRRRKTASRPSGSTCCSSISRKGWAASSRRSAGPTARQPACSRSS